MKAILILFLLLINLHAEFFPDENDPLTATSEFKDVPQSSPDSEFKYYDGNQTRSVTANPNSYIINNYGKKNLQNDLNVSNPKDLKGLSDLQKNSVAAQGEALFQSLSSSVGGVNTGNMESLKAEYIKTHDANSSEAIAINTVEGFYAKARSLVANLKTIECYVSRRLVNSYYCPLPGMENSFFKGGAIKDKKEDAKKECEKLCSVPVSCIPKEMNKDTLKEATIALELDNNEHTLAMPIDINMSLEYVSLSFDALYQYDNEIQVNSPDYDPVEAEKALKKTTHKIRVSVTYIDVQGIERKLIDATEFNINDIHKEMKLYFPTFHSSSLRVHLYAPYELDKEGKELFDEKLKLTFQNYAAKYVDNKWWFCPETNFVANAATCSGEIKLVQIGASIRNICVTEEGRSREPVYGAYYTQDECEYACKNTADCVPTYRHLSNFDPYNVPVSLSNVEVGCVDNPSNTSCTKELCMEFFNEDSLPISEKSWTNDDKVVLTVNNGIPSSKYIRPRIDLEGELSSNDDEAAKKAVAINEMSEITYQNMLREGTYDISQKTLNENIHFKNGYDITINSSRVKSLIWKMRPNSFDIGDGKSYYVYALFDYQSVFDPVASTYLNNDGTMSPWMDRTYIIKTPLGSKVIRRIENYARYDFGNPDLNITGSWVKVDSMQKDQFEIFNSIGFSAIDPNSQAEYLSHQEFKPDKNWEEYILYNSIESLSLTPGVLFHTQNLRNNGTFMNRIFDAPIDQNLSSRFYGVDVYGVYSETPLTYKEIFDTVNANAKEHLVYSTSSKTNKEVRSDGEYNLDSVKMFVSGKPENMAVRANFQPKAREEGKKAFIFMLLFDKN